MTEYKIYPIWNGDFHMNWGQIMAPLCDGYHGVVPVFCFLIEGPDEFIMFDTGYKFDNVPAKIIFQPDRQKEDASIARQLREHGCEPEDIKTVIISHLHHDHTGNMDLFPNAEFIVQEKELLGTTYPVGSQAIGVAFEDWQKFVPRFRLIDGDFEIRDGIKLYLTPGHTEGHQAAVVNTSMGKCAIMGDACYMYGGLSRRFPDQFDDLIDKTVTVMSGAEPGTPEHDAMKVAVPALAEYMAEKGRHSAYFGPSISNPGQNVGNIEKLDLLSDLILTHHDSFVHKFKVIPDDYHLINDVKFRAKHNK